MYQASNMFDKSLPKDIWYTYILNVYQMSINVKTWNVKNTSWQKLSNLHILPQ